MQRSINFNSCSLNNASVQQGQGKNTCTPMSDNNVRNAMKRSTWGITDYPLASVYAPVQEFDELYDCETSLVRGTIFKQLDLPFHGATVSRGGN